MDYVLFICGHNAGRSQMSQAFFNVEKKNFPNVDKRYEAISAGTRPGSKVNPTVIEAMKEIGIDLFDRSIYFPKPLSDVSIISKGDHLKRVIISCDDSCLLPAGLPQIPFEKWNLSDPYQQPVEKVRVLRDEVKAKVIELLHELNNQLS